MQSESTEFFNGLKKAGNLDAADKVDLVLLGGTFSNKQVEGKLESEN